jgi:hypothetical protein
MKNDNKRDDSSIVFAIILIVVGIVWALSRIGFNTEIWNFFRDSIFNPFSHMFGQLFHILFSWPMIILFVGIVLLAGKRSIGWVPLIIGCIYLFPRIFSWHELSLSLLLPLALVAFGVVLVIRAL